MAEEEKKDEVSQEKVKTPWQLKKESWYDKIPLTLKQLDIIVVICWIALGLCALCIALEAMGIIRLFG